MTEAQRQLINYYSFLRFTQKRDGLYFTLAFFKFFHQPLFSFRYASLCFLCNFRIVDSPSYCMCMHCTFHCTYTCVCVYIYIYMSYLVIEFYLASLRFYTLHEMSCVLSSQCLVSSIKVGFYRGNFLAIGNIVASFFRMQHMQSPSHASRATCCLALPCVASVDSHHQSKKTINHYISCI